MSEVRRMVHILFLFVVLCVCMNNITFHTGLEYRIQIGSDN